MKQRFKNRGILHDLECGLHSGFSLCCIFYYVFLWQPYYHLFKHRWDGVRVYHRFTRWVCDKRGVGQPKIIKVQFPGDPEEIEVEVIYPTFEMIACPYCLLFSKPAKVIRCDCQVPPQKTNMKNSFCLINLMQSRKFKIPMFFVMVVCMVANVFNLVRAVQIMQSSAELGVGLFIMGIVGMLLCGISAHYHRPSQW